MFETTWKYCVCLDSRHDGKYKENEVWVNMVQSFAFTTFMSNFIHLGFSSCICRCIADPSALPPGQLPFFVFHFHCFEFLFPSPLSHRLRVSSFLLIQNLISPILLVCWYFNLKTLISDCYLFVAGTRWMEGSGGGGASPSAPVKQYLHDFSKLFQYYLDKSTPHSTYRWIGTFVIASIYVLRVVYVQGFYIVSYGLGTSLQCTLIFLKDERNKISLP